jgi:hypothetical protein
MLTNKNETNKNLANKEGEEETKANTCSSTTSYMIRFWKTQEGQKDKPPKDLGRWTQL